MAGQADGLSALAGLAGTNTPLPPAEYAKFYHNRLAKPSNIVPFSPVRVLDTATGLLLKRRAVRLACPDRRIASRKKGRRDALPYVSPSPSTRQGCQKVAGGRSGRKGADHRIDARIAMHLGEVPETALPVWELISLPDLKSVVWHPSGMQTDRRPRTGGRSPLQPWNDTPATLYQPCRVGPRSTKRLQLKL